MALPVAEFLALEHGTEYAGGAEDVAKLGDDEQQACMPLRLPVPATPAPGLRPCSKGRGPCREHSPCFAYPEIDLCT